jgi:hypothetical protein
MPRIAHFTFNAERVVDVSYHDEREKAPDAAARVRRSAAEHRELERVRAMDAVEATFPLPASATTDELVQMAIHALGFDAASLAASLGISRTEGEASIRNPGTLSPRHRSLLAQYLEMRGDARTAERNRAIATRLRQQVAEDKRAITESRDRPDDRPVSPE